MGVLKVLVDGVWVPVGGNTTITYGGSGGYDCAVLTVTQDGQQSFNTPEHAGQSKSYVSLNGIQYTAHENDYTTSGTDLVWADEELEVGEVLLFYHVPIEEE